jgi:hypothetical protein
VIWEIIRRDVGLVTPFVHNGDRLAIGVEIDYRLFLAIGAGDQKRRLAIELTGHCIGFLTVPAAEGESSLWHKVSLWVSGNTTADVGSNGFCNYYDNVKLDRIKCDKRTPGSQIETKRKEWIQC